jgi:ABC-type antimicrobial peptide transport system permease subunit
LEYPAIKVIGRINLFRSISSGFAKDKSVGLAIWDAQLKDSKWRTKEIWQTISRIRHGADLNGTGSPSISA